jgi:hypothetical protein
MEPPDGKPVKEYTTHERRAEILRVMKEAGSPFAVKQVRLAERYGVHESTISRDMDRLRESVDEFLGQDAKLTTRALLEKTVRELQNAGEWKAAWDVVMDWNEWLADLGEQHREPRRSEVGVDVTSRHAEVAYTIVREGDDEPLPTVDGASEAGSEAIDYDELGFTSAPATIDVEASEGGAPR